MDKIRILIVDDSVVIRRMLTDILREEAGFEVVGAAANGRIALAKIGQLAPDLITLDIEMPEMDGLQTLRELKDAHSDIPVVMFSTLTERGAFATLEALSLGAKDYVAKPTKAASIAEAIQSVRESLIPKIKALCQPQSNSGASTRAISHQTSPIATSKAKSSRKEVVLIGSSTGGPQALAVLLSSLPQDFPLPIVVTQHMPPVFTKSLATRLNEHCLLEVSEAEGGETLVPGQVLIAPGNYHLTFKKDRTSIVTEINQDALENSCRPSVDVMFRSAAELYGPGCLGVVLTGMGRDGCRGSGQIVDKGGYVIAQDEASSVVWGMPRAVTEAGFACEVLPIQKIADAVFKYSFAGKRFFNPIATRSTHEVR